jgi:hypothetical protein
MPVDRHWRQLRRQRRHQASKEVLAFFNSFVSFEMGNRWLDNVQVQTGIKSDPAKLTGPRPPTTSR